MRSADKISAAVEDYFAERNTALAEPAFRGVSKFREKLKASGNWSNDELNEVELRIFRVIAASWSREE